MNSEAFVIGIMAVTAGTGFIVWVVANTFVRLRQGRTSLSSPELEARLARIEAAVDTIAVEVERNGELLRFNARLADGMLPASVARTERPITPH